MRTTPEPTTMMSSNLKGNHQDGHGASPSSSSLIGGKTADIRVDVAHLNPGETVCIVGSSPQLGSWNVASCVPLKKDSNPESHAWYGQIDVPADRTVEYRYLVTILVDKTTNEVVHPKLAPFNNGHPLIQDDENGDEVPPSGPIPILSSGQDDDNALDAADYLATEDQDLSEAFTSALRRRPEVIVRRWETHIHPRVLRPLDHSPTSSGKVSIGDSGDGSGSGGTPVNSCPPPPTLTDQFGLLNGEEKVDSGWITREIVVQFQLHHNAIQIWKTRYQGRTFSFKMSPVDIQRKDSMATLAPDEQPDDHSTQMTELVQEWPVIEVAALNEGEWEFHRQEQFGHVYSPEGYIIFQAQMLHLERTAYLMDFYVNPTIGSDSTTTGSGGAPEHIGYCYILPSNLRGTFGSLVMPITGTKHQPIGQLNVDYLIVHPLKGFQCDARVSYASYWKPVKLDVGHRGAGNARRTDLVTNVVENTIASFNHAARHGADLVELDVQLSRDKVPVIYHDFKIQIAMKKKKVPNEHERLQVSVKELTVQQLQMLKLSPIEKATHAQWDFDEDDSHDNEPFPTLKNVLECVDKTCGVNVEIKCPMLLQNGNWDAELGCELNEYVDTILQTVLENAGQRYIIFSAFNPDVCTMIRLKQNKYPLLFLTQGQSTKWEPYMDPRTSTVPLASFFAKASHFLGINVHAEDILKDNKLIRWVKDHRLILFLWGSDLNSGDVIGRLKKEGVDGVIYDKIDELSAQQADVFVAEPREARLALLQIIGHSASTFESSCGSAGSYTSETSLTKPSTSI